VNENNHPNVIAICNGKGGAAKTTATVNLGYALADAGLKVLIIDLDHSACATKALLGKPINPHTYSVFEFIAGMADNRKITFQDVAIERWKNLTLIPSKERLEEIETIFTFAANKNPRGDMRLYLRYRIKSIDEAFDIILLDCPSGNRYIPKNALIAANYVIIPGYDIQSIEGAVELKDKIDFEIREMNPSIRILGFLVTKYAGRFRRDGDFDSKLEKCIMFDVFKTRIREDRKIDEAYKHGKTILEYKRWSNAGMDYARLAGELMNKLDAMGKED